MTMHNPVHPGDFIKEIFIQPSGLSIRQVAEKMKVSPSTFSRLVSGLSAVSPEMALRLSKTLGRTPESWLLMQDQYDLWHARKKIDLRNLSKLKVPAEHD